MTVLKVERLHQAQARYARYYYEKLYAANRLYQDGNYTVQALRVLERDWLQIQQSHTWTATTLNNPEARALCSAYASAGRMILKSYLPIPEQIQWLEAALDAALALDDRRAVVDHQIELGQAYLTATQIDHSHEIYEQALAQAAAIGYQDGMARARIGLGRVLLMHPPGRDQAEQHLQAALGYYRQVGNADGEIWALINLSSLMERLYDLDLAAQYVDEALAALPRHPDERYHILLLKHQSTLAEMGGDLATGYHYIEQALERARQTANRELIIGCLSSMGFILSYQNQLEQSERCYREALQLAYEIANQQYISNCLFNLGWLAKARQQYDEALAIYYETLYLYQDMGHTRLVYMTLVSLGMIYLLTGQIEPAHQRLVEGLRVYTGIDNLDDLFWLLLIGAQLIALKGDPGRGALWFHTVMLHPAVERAELHEDGDLVRDQIRGLLTPAEWEAAADRARDLTVEQVFDALRAYLESSV